MGIVKDLTPRRIMATILAAVTVGSSLPALAENNEVELGTATRIVEINKGEPNTISPVEEQIKNATTEEIQEEAGQVEEQKQERQMINSVEEFMAFRDSVLAKGWNRRIINYTTTPGNDLDKQVNGIILTLSSGSCTEIQNELRKTGEFVKTNVWPFFSSSYHVTLGFFMYCANIAAKYPDLDMTDFIFDEGDKEKFREIYGPAEEFAKANKNKKPSIDKIKDMAQTITTSYDEVVENGDLTLYVYHSYASIICRTAVEGKVSEWKSDVSPNLDSNNVNEVGNAFILLTNGIAEKDIDAIHAIEEALLKVKKH